jgi:hypothetical protein
MADRFQHLLHHDAPPEDFSLIREIRQSRRAGFLFELGSGAVAFQNEKLADPEPQFLQQSRRHESRKHRVTQAIQRRGLFGIHARIVARLEGRRRPSSSRRLLLLESHCLPDLAAQTLDL